MDLVGEQLLKGEKVSFAEALENELNSAKTGNHNLKETSAEAKFAKRLQRGDVLDAEAPVAAPEILPAWLLQSAAEGAEVANSEDILEEFLHDDDMCSLEMMCAKYRGIDDSDMEDIANIMPETVSSLLKGDEHIQEFLNYRRQLNEKFTRKKSVNNKRRGAMPGRNLGSLDEDGEAKEDSSEVYQNDVEGQNAGLDSKDSCPGIGFLREAAASRRNGPTATPSSNQLGGSARRHSNANARLARTGAAIVGQDDANSPVKLNPTPGPPARRTSVTKAEEVSVSPAPGRRISLGKADGAVSAARRVSLSKARFLSNQGAAEATPNKARFLSNQSAAEATPNRSVAPSPQLAPSPQPCPSESSPLSSPRSTSNGRPKRLEVSPRPAV